MLDIVYPLKIRGDCTELRFSLRSLVNLPHRRVFIAGDCPHWVQNVTHVPVPQTASKYENSLANILAACRHPELTDDFVLMNDDFYVMSPKGGLPAFHQGDLQAYIEKCPHRDRYLDLIVQTKQLLDEQGITDAKFYGIHIPTVLNKHKVLELAERFAGRPIMLRTLYHNIYQSGGIEWRDVKKYSAYDSIVEPDFLSSSDLYAQLPMFRNHMHKRFPEACYYEKQ